MRKLIGLLLLVFWAFPAQAETYSIATGSPSGLYYPIGGGLAALWSEESDSINMKAEVTSASVANLIQVHKGESELGITQGDALRDAIAGTGKFPKPLDVAVLFALYPNIVHALVPAESDIRSIEDLRGKRVSVGAAGSGSMVTTQKVLQELGLTENDYTPYYLSYTETTNALRDGTVDAGFVVGGIGVAVVVELALTRDIRLIPFSDGQMAQLSSKFPAYRAFSIPKGVYKGVETPVQTVSLWNYMVVCKDMDDVLVEELLRITFGHLDRVHALAYAARFITPGNSRQYGEGLLHPAAARYFGLQ